MARSDDLEQHTGITCQMPCIVPGAPSRACLLRVDGPDRGRRYDLGDRPFTIGRDATNDITIEDAAVAPTHTILIATAGGTRVRGPDHTAAETHLEAEAVLRIGPAIFKHLRDPNLDMVVEQERYLLKTTDPETHVFNRAYLLKTLEWELEQVCFHKRPHALVLLPVDPSIGVPALAELAERLERRLRRIGTFARFADDAFVLLALGLDRAGAEACAAALRRHTAAPPRVLDLTGTEDTTDTLVARIDALLADTRQSRARAKTK